MANSVDQFHITVGAAISSNFTFQNEVRLLKAAILYADKVKLCSLSSSFLVSMLLLCNMSEEESFELIEQISGPLGYNTNNTQLGIELYKQLKKKKGKTRDELLIYLNMKNKLKKGLEILSEKVRKFFSERELDTILEALNTGLIDLHVLDVANENIVNEFFDVISQSLLSGDTYPLFDDQTGGLVNAAIEEGKIYPFRPSISKSKQIGISYDLFKRLPLFDEVSFDELIDIRNELNRYLVKFRSAIITFSREIESAAWEKDFPYEVDQLFIEKVKPTIIEIEEAVKSNRLLLKLASNFAQKSIILPSSSALGFLISRLDDIPNIISQSLAIGLGATAVASNTIYNWKVEKNKIEKNQLYFYYKLGKELGN